MSEYIGKVKSIYNTTDSDLSQDIRLVSFWGGNKNKSCIQLTIGSSYAKLDKKGIKKLRKLLKNYVR